MKPLTQIIGEWVIGTTAVAFIASILLAAFLPELLSISGLFFGG